MDWNKKYILLNDQLDLTFDYYVREPVRVIEKKLDTIKKKVTWSKANSIKSLTQSDEELSRKYVHKSKLNHLAMKY